MKHQVGTSIEEADMVRVRAIKEKLNVSEAWVLRRAVLLGLSDVEREVLGVSPAPAPVAMVKRKATKQGEAA